jgi:hypothetical protein
MGTLVEFVGGEHLVITTPIDKVVQIMKEA